MAGKEEVEAVERTRPKTHQLVNSQSEEAVKSAFEVVHHFASNYKKDMDESIREFQPHHATAKEWRRGMDEYLRGNLRKQIHSKLKGVAKKPGLLEYLARLFDVRSYT